MSIKLKIYLAITKTTKIISNQISSIAYIRKLIVD